jgi:Spy/CpxP family protein refolding chaperone
MKRMMILAAAVALLMWWEGAARAQGHGGPFKAPCGDSLVQSLGLTDAQSSSLAALKTQTHTSLAAVHDQEKAIHESLHTQVTSASPDRGAIGDLVIQGFALHKQVDATLTGAEATFVGSLTADQKSKYDAFVAAHPGCKVFSGPMHPPGF